MHPALLSSFGALLLVGVAVSGIRSPALRKTTDTAIPCDEAQLDLSNPGGNLLLAKAAVEDDGLDVTLFSFEVFSTLDIVDIDVFSSSGDLLISAPSTLSSDTCNIFTVVPNGEDLRGGDEIFVCLSNDGSDCSNSLVVEGRDRTECTAENLNLSQTGIVLARFERDSVSGFTIEGIRAGNETLVLVNAQDELAHAAVPNLLEGVFDTEGECRIGGFGIESDPFDVFTGEEVKLCLQSDFSVCSNTVVTGGNELRVVEPSPSPSPSASCPSRLLQLEECNSGILFSALPASVVTNMLASEEGVQFCEGVPQELGEFEDFPEPEF